MSFSPSRAMAIAMAIAMAVAAVGCSDSLVTPTAALRSNSAALLGEESYEVPSAGAAYAVYFKPGRADAVASRAERLAKDRFSLPRVAARRRVGHDFREVVD